MSGMTMNASLSLTVYTLLLLSGDPEKTSILARVDEYPFGRCSVEESNQCYHPNFRHIILHCTTISPVSAASLSTWAQASPPYPAALRSSRASLQALEQRTFPTDLQC